MTLLSVWAAFGTSGDGKDGAKQTALLLLTVVLLVMWVAYTFLKVLMRPLTSDTHSFTPTNQTKSRKERTAYLPPAGYFLNKSNLYIYTQTWLPSRAAAGGNVSAVVVLLHGVGEHCGRYQGLAQQVSDTLGVAVVALDHQGHGKSEGDRLFVTAFDDYLDDVEQLCKLTKTGFPDVPFLILGHSMGGLLAIRAVERYPRIFSAAVFSAPALSVVASGLEMRMVPFLSHYLPHLSTTKIDPNLLTHDACAVDLYCNDPLCTPRGVSARLASEVLYAIDEALAYAAEIQIPILIIRGAEDRVTLKPGIEQFYKTVSSSDKTFLELPGLYHEIFNERKSNAKDVVIKWLSERLKHGSA